MKKLSSFEKSSKSMKNDVAIGPLSNISVKTVVTSAQNVWIPQDDFNI